jgi:D-methionine transport system permease protein
MSSLASFFAQYGSLLGEGLADTLVMLFVSTAFSYVIGIFLGVVLCVTAPRGLHPMRTLNAVLGWVVNIGRSIPFIILWSRCSRSRAPWLAPPPACRA